MGWTTETEQLITWGAGTIAGIYIINLLLYGLVYVVKRALSKDDG